MVFGSRNPKYWVLGPLGVYIDSIRLNPLRLSRGSINPNPDTPNLRSKPRNSEEWCRLSYSPHALPYILKPGLPIAQNRSYLQTLAWICSCWMSAARTLESTRSCCTAWRFSPQRERPQSREPQEYSRNMLTCDPMVLSSSSCMSEVPCLESPVDSIKPRPRRI